MHVDAVRLDGRSMGEAQVKPSRNKTAKMLKKNHDDSSAWENALREAYEVGVRSVVNSGTTLSALRSGYDVLQVNKGELESLLPVSGPFRDRVHALLKMYNIKMQLIRVLAQQREAQGDVDDGGDVPPTKRVNICGKIDEYNVTADIGAEIKEICAKLDRLREVVLSGGDTYAKMSEVVSLANALRALPGYDEMPIAGELELVLEEEDRWVKNHWDEENRRPKEPPPRFTTAVPTAPTPSAAAVMVDSAQKAVGFAEASKLAQATTTESSFSLSALPENLDRVDVSKEKVLAVGAPQSEKVNSQLTLVNENGEESEMLAEALQAEGLDDNVASEHERGSQDEEENDPTSKLELGLPGAEEGDLSSDYVTDSLDAEGDTFSSNPELGPLDEEEDNLHSEPELGPQSAADDNIMSDDVTAAPCINFKVYEHGPEVHAKLDEIGGELRRPLSTSSDDDAATESWTKALGELARRVVALFMAGPLILYDCLVMLAREKSTILGQLAQGTIAPRAPPDVAEDADGSDVGAQSPGRPGAPANAIADGANDTVPERSKSAGI